VAWVANTQARSVSVKKAPAELRRKNRQLENELLKRAVQETTALLASNPNPV
jgi:hypothetical protein